MPSLDSVTYGAGLPSTEKSENPRNSMVFRDKGRSVQESETGWTASEETRQCSPNRSELDNRDRKWDHDNTQAISGSTTGGHDPLLTQWSKSVQRPAEFQNDEARRAAEIEIDQDPLQMINFDPDEARAMVTKYIEDRARETQRRLDAKEIKRIKMTNCCRCHSWSVFSDGVEEEEEGQAEPGKSLPGGQPQETRNVTKRVHEQDDKQTVKRLRAERDRLRAMAGEQSHVLESQKEHIEQLQKAFEEKGREMEKLKDDIKRVSERQSADVARHQKSIRNFERALKTSTDYAESNRTQYNLQLDRTKQLTRTIYDYQKVIKETRAMIHMEEKEEKEEKNLVGELRRPPENARRKQPLNRQTSMHR
ncbi:MAG: hypothetical protein Q9209_007161 [Squamulea sp. 1 TL-2023]